MRDARLWDDLCERLAYEMAYKRCTPVRDTPMRYTPVRDASMRWPPMRWPLGEARL
jgi:hypothetical protein